MTRNDKGVMRKLWRFSIIRLECILVCSGKRLFVHEFPNIGANYSNILEKNSEIKVEPGIYIPGWDSVQMKDQELPPENI